MRTMDTAFSTEVRNTLHHYCYSKNVDQELVLQNLDINGSTPITASDRNCMINEVQIA